MFSANHRQHLLVALRHLDEMLTEVATQLGAPPAPALFQHWRPDADPVARQHAMAAIAALRGDMRSFIEYHALAVEPATIGSTHAARALLAMATADAEELGPRYLRGYGALDTAEADELERLVGMLRGRLVAVLRALPEPR